MSPSKKTVRGAKASGRKSARKSSSRSSESRAADATAGAGGVGQPASAAPPAHGGIPRSVPAESAEARAQAERDEKGETRAGYVRRDLANTSTFNDVTYQAGANREVPEAFAAHLDLINVPPDASTEANRDKKFGAGEEDDQDAQGESVKAAREAAPEAQRKHQQSDAFAPMAGGSKKSSGKK
jgi:hypothetical protein